MFCNGKETNWICPSDRQLLLRSKLHLGWSVHSHNIFHHLQSFEDSDMSLILHVLSRACKVQETEHKRVGSLVQRLENKKRNICGNGFSSCAMCAQSLGWFKSSTYICLDCQKLVCNKCCVDTWSVVHEPMMLCKICAENRELWKKTGGWFYGYLPTHEKDLNKLSSPTNNSQATWSHRIREIVRFESFESPNIDNIEERFTGKWASNSSIAETDLKNSTGTIDSISNNANEFLNISSMTIKGGSMLHLTAINKTNDLESMSSISSSCPSLVPLNPSNQTVFPQGDGILDFSLMYNSQSKVLQCTIYSVKELVACNTNDVKYYLKVQFNIANKKTITLKTKSVTQKVKMEFNETLVFSKIRSKILKGQFVKLLLILEHHFTDKLIGEVNVNLNILKPMKNKFFTMKMVKSEEQ